jgi:hypothetical protein
MSLTPEWDKIIEDKIIELEGLVKGQLEALEALVDIVEDDHYKCNIDSDEDCVRTAFAISAVEYMHGAIRQARQAIAMAKGDA